jgi:hypothetical protein
VGGGAPKNILLRAKTKQIALNAVAGNIHLFMEANAQLLYINTTYFINI